MTPFGRTAPRVIDRGGRTPTAGVENGGLKDPLPNVPAIADRGAGLHSRRNAAAGVRASRALGSQLTVRH